MDRSTLGLGIASQPGDEELYIFREKWNVLQPSFILCHGSGLSIYQFQSMLMQASRTSNGSHPKYGPFIRKQLCTSHMEDLPPIIPHSAILCAISFFQMGPDFFLTGYHLRQPNILIDQQPKAILQDGGRANLTSLGIMLPETHH